MINKKEIRNLYKNDVDISVIDAALFHIDENKETLLKVVIGNVDYEIGIITDKQIIDCRRFLNEDNVIICDMCNYYNFITVGISKLSDGDAVSLHDKEKKYMFCLRCLNYDQAAEIQKIIYENIKIKKLDRKLH